MNKQRRKALLIRRKVRRAREKRTRVIIRNQLKKEARYVD
jgi:hypothetical protein